MPVGPISSLFFCYFEFGIYNGIGSHLNSLAIRIKNYGFYFATGSAFLQFRLIFFCRANSYIHGLVQVLLGTFQYGFKVFEVELASHSA